MTAAVRTFDEIRLLAGRSLRHIPRIPEKAFGAVILPLVFVLMFSYVFGSAISIPGGDYHAYLVAGIFAQSMVGTVPGIAVGVASDIRSGLMDRLRTLPIWSGSVIAGRTIAELAELAGGMSSSRCAACSSAGRRTAPCSRPPARSASCCCRPSRSHGRGCSSA